MYGCRHHQSRCCHTAGVDVISVSLGGKPSDYLGDGLAIAASTLDRSLHNTAKLQSGLVLREQAFETNVPEEKFYPLISAAQAKSANASVYDRDRCKEAPETVLHTKPAPFMAVFSSVGPNTITPQILKLHTVKATNPSENYDKRKTPFNMISGTSMCAPILLVSLLKSLHPDWSPTAIRSAIMTTGTGSPYHCPKKQQQGLNNLLNFNNPAITILNISPSAPVTVTRRLKNVGSPGLYTARVRLHRSIFSITIEPAS
ncbi:hypothetical protein HAX54_032265 [Datura stramonium]|uniref:Peptidase S8/S53 domain-containing protein n=1 Tax=Datura stramonium TaxID=4076 RepID=A0ABS8RLH6_DATST|nr:hypothetical protein [Datura stramonium]